MATHPVLICTHCGGDLQKEFERIGKTSSQVKCKCGNIKDVVEAMAEDQKHTEFELNGVDPIGIRNKYGKWEYRF